MVNLSNNDCLDRIRVGRDYQTQIPDLQPEEGRNLELIKDPAILVWSPNEKIADDKLDEYLEVACKKFNYNGEQALGMLFWHKYDLQKATQDLSNFTPLPNGWTDEEKLLFERSINIYGKDFHMLQQMLPQKTLGSLVTFYYLSKKFTKKEKKTRAAADLKDATTSAGSSDTKAEVKDDTIVLE